MKNVFLENHVFTRFNLSMTHYLSGVSPLLGVVCLHAGPRPHAQLAPGAGRVNAGQPGVVADMQGPDK